MATKKASSETKKAPAPAKSAAKPASPYDAIQSAVTAARAGDVASARASLEVLAAQDNVPACAAFAVILAFEGDFAAMIPFAASVVRQNRAVATGNVDTEMSKLLLRAGHVTGKWSEIATVLPETRNDPINDHLRVQAAAGGTLVDPTFVPAAKQPEELRRQYFADALAGAPKMPRYKKAPDELPAYAFTMASSYFLEDEILARYPAVASKLRFNDAVPYFKALIHAGKIDDAWKAVLTHLGSWSPVDRCQIAPVELLVDADLRPMMTPERSRTVLSTPRALSTTK